MILNKTHIKGRKKVTEKNEKFSNEIDAEKLKDFKSVTSDGFEDSSNDNDSFEEPKEEFQRKEGDFRKENNDDEVIKNTLIVGAVTLGAIGAFALIKAAR